METTAYVTEKVNAPFKLMRVNIDSPGPDEVLVEITSVGICHTDESARTGIIPVPLPAVLGHEGAGIVAEVGSNVKDFVPGDKVAMSFGYCGECIPCKKGRPYACEMMVPINFCGVAWDGKHKLRRQTMPLSSFFSQSSLAHHSLVHKNSLVKVEEGFPLKMAGPLGCGVQTGAGIVLNCLKPEVGDSIAVFGCGAVGMSAIIAARLTGCLNIIAVGGNEESLRIAKEVGATHTINRKQVDDIPAAIRAITGSGAEYAVDTSGVESMVRTALQSLNYTGKLATAGPTQIALNTGGDIGAKCLVGVTEGHSNPKVFIPQLMKYYLQGRFPIDKIMKFYDFDEIDTAMEEANSGKAIKSVLIRKDI